MHKKNCENIIAALPVSFGSGLCPSAQVCVPRLGSVSLGSGLSAF